MPDDLELLTRARAATAIVDIGTPGMAGLCASGSPSIDKIQDLLDMLRYKRFVDVSFHNFELLGPFLVFCI